MSIEAAREEVGIVSVRLGKRRVNVVTDAQVQREFAVHAPVVKRIERSVPMYGNRP